MYVSTTKITSELSRLTRVEKAVKNTIIIVIYKVLVYLQMSQPTTYFGLF